MVQASEFYDAYVQQGEENRACKLAKKYRDAAKYRTLSEKVSALTAECNGESEWTENEKVKKKIILAQGIALLGHRELDDDAVKKAILDIVTRTEIKTSGTALKTALKTTAQVGAYATRAAAFFAPKDASMALKLSSKVLKEAGKTKVTAKTKIVEIDKTGVGEAAAYTFITGPHAKIPSAELHGLQGEKKAIEFCLHCSRLIKYQVMTETSKIYFVHQFGTDEEKISNALRAYVRLEENENVVMIYDPTFFGGAEEGIALTTERIFFCKGKETHFVHYRHIKDASWKEGSEEIVLERTNGKKISLDDLGDESRAKRMCKAILLMRDEAMEWMKNNPELAPKTHATHCPNCGAKLLGGAKFCIECGTKIED